MSDILFLFALGLILGWFLEFTYRSYSHKKIVLPKLMNVCLYGTATLVAAVVYKFWNPSFVVVVLIGILATTGLEYLVGSLYLKMRGGRLWYYREPFSFRGHINLYFSLLWLGLFLLLYYVILPLFEI